MRVFEGLGGLRQDVESVGDIEWSGGGDIFLEMPASAQLDRIIELAFDNAAVGDAGDAGMGEARLFPCLLEEARAGGFVQRVAFINEFEGDFGIEQRMPGEEVRPNPPRPSSWTEPSGRTSTSKLPKRSPVVSS